MNPRSKGKRGENEACEWLSKYLYDNKRQLTINHNQMFIGCDIVSKPFIFEVKRSEILHLDKWWIQIHKVFNVLKAHNQLFIPVVMFRQNNRVWEFLISAEAIGSDTGYIRLSQMVFKHWAKHYI
mgnify:CR=1 FL=1